MLRRNRAVAGFLLTFAIPLVAMSATAQPDDAKLQSAVTRTMAGKRGTAVVLDVSSGRILAAYHLEVAARRLARPGSSIKPFTLLALLESGKVNTQTTLMCKRTVSLGGRNLNCSHPATAQPLDPVAALAYSCNSWFTAVALRLTPAQLRDSLVRDGFSGLTSLAPKEAAGSVALAHSTEELQLQAVGEWGITVTPLELVEAYRRLALLERSHDGKLDPLFEGLQQSVAYGMGNAAQPSAEMRVAGKTGTAPSDEGAWTHAWFAGYAPAVNPEIVLVVFLERGHGGGDAAAAAHEIFGAFAETQRSKLRAAGAAR